MKALITFWLLLCSYILSAQEVNKADYIGVFQNNKLGGDTVSGYVCLSLDSFKIIYTVITKDGADFQFPVETGTWVVNGKDARFKCNNGGILHGKLSEGHFETGNMTGPIPMIDIENKSFSNLSHAHKSAVE